MKRVYERPMMFAQEFMANEYVAACGASGKTYKFVCDAGYLEKAHQIGICGCGSIHGLNVPDGTYKVKASWKVTDANGRSLMNGYTSYSPCGITHEASSSDEFVIGYMDNINTLEKEAVEVMTWAGPNGDNIHCTTNLNISSWETTKS